MPVNITPLSDETIARGVQAADFSKFDPFGSYFAGADRAQQQKLQNLFSDIQIDPKTGIPYATLGSRLLQAGGAPQVPAAVDLLNLEALRNLPPLPTGDPGISRSPQQAPRPNPAPVSLSRSTIQTAPDAQDSGGTPAPPGQNVVRSDEVPNTAQMSVDGGPFTPLQPTSVKTAQMTTARSLAERTGQDVQVVADAFGVTPDQGISTDEVRQKLPALRQQLAGGPQAQNVPQVTIPARPQDRPAEDLSAQSRQVPTVSAPIRNENDPGYYSIENAKAFFARGRLLEATANQAALIKGGQAIAADRQKAADNEFAIGKQILDTVGKNKELTPEEKNALSSGFGSPYQFERGKKVQEAELVRGDATYKGLSSQSNQYEQDLKPYLQQAKAIINDPSMYSGFGSEASLNWNKIRSNFGDRQAALLQEALQKITAQSVLGTLNLQRDQMQQTGAQSGRIFSQQVDQVNKAVAGLPTTLPGNRYLVEMQMRLGEQSAKIYDLARDYVAKHGAIDAGFDNVMSVWLRKPENQPFTKDELSYPQLMGAPSVPPAMANNPAAIVQWGQALGLKPGEAIRFPNGKIHSFTLAPKVQ